MAGNLTSCCTTARKPQERSHGSHFTSPDAGSDRCRSLLTTTTIVNAQTGPFRSKPGTGVARAATELPAGDKVAYHDPKDLADLPDFRFALDGSRPKVTSGGWAKEATVHQFPISKGMAASTCSRSGRISRATLARHRSRMAYVIDGRCQTVFSTRQGERDQQLRAGRSMVLPQGPRSLDPDHRHKPCHFVSPSTTAASPSTAPSRSRTGPTWRQGHAGAQLRRAEGCLDAFPKGETTSRRAGCCRRRKPSTPWPKESTHKFSLLHDNRAVRDFDGGTFRLATVDEWPISRAIQAA